MRTCPYCGSNRLKEVGGENGNPFNRRLGKTVCLECGRTVYNDVILLSNIVIEKKAFSVGKRKHLSQEDK